MAADTYFNLIKYLANRRIGTIAFLGFASGLPLALTGGTLQAWMAVEGVDLKTIGIFSLVGLPYALKFFWAPLLDRYALPFLGRRRGWIIASQGFLIGLIVILSFCSPKNTPLLVALICLMLTFTSASQDIVIDAYRADVLREKERGLGAAVSVTGYRIAMLVSGALALILAGSLGWHMTYLLMGGLMLVGMTATFFGPEPEEIINPPKTLRDAISGPLKEFFNRPACWSFLALIILYKIGDAFAGSLTTAFLIRGPGFSIEEVGIINKGLGLAATIFGALYGGLMLARLGLYKSLMAFGILQAISNLSFMWLAYVGKVYSVMVVAVAFENLAGGMGTAAFVAFLMTLCDRRYTATQFALLSALASVGRIFVGPPSGFLAEELGWVIFFFITFLAALPGLALLYRMRFYIFSLDENIKISMADQLSEKNKKLEK